MRRAKARSGVRVIRSFVSRGYQRLSACECVRAWYNENAEVRSTAVRASSDAKPTALEERHREGDGPCVSSCLCACARARVRASASVSVTASASASARARARASASVRLSV
eukprot:6194763-Pleurochrysis_carterae.AAC.2